MIFRAGMNYKHYLHNYMWACEEVDHASALEY